MNNTHDKKQLTRPLIISGIVILGMLLISFWTWSQLPAGTEIPVHWGIDGQPDRYGGVFEGLFLLPLITAGVVALLYAVPYIEPRRFNLQQSLKPYYIVWILTVLLMGAIHVMANLWALGYSDSVPINIILPIGLGIMFMGIGNFMGKVRSNYMFGIRTPWTLTSELSWNKTHRLGGKLFFVFGLVMLLDGLFFTGGNMFPIIMVGVIGILIVTFGYSYWIWKDDPAVQTG